MLTPMLLFRVVSPLSTVHFSPLPSFLFRLLLFSPYSRLLSPAPSSLSPSLPVKTCTLLLYGHPLAVRTPYCCTDTLLLYGHPLAVRTQPVAVRRPSGCSLLSPSTLTFRFFQGPLYEAEVRGFPIPLFLSLTLTLSPLSHPVSLCHYPCVQGSNPLPAAWLHCQRRT